MKIRIPEGKRCVEKRTLKYCVFCGVTDLGENCQTFEFDNSEDRELKRDKYGEPLKLKECIKEFGEGGDFILIPDWWQARPRRKLTEKENKQLVKAMEKMFKEVK